jgi:hypothetical protein
MKKDKNRIKGEQDHENKSRIKAYEPGPLGHQCKGNGDLRKGDEPDEEGSPGIWKGLVVDIADEASKVKEFTYARIQKKHYQ